MSGAGAYGPGGTLPCARAGDGCGTGAGAEKGEIHREGLEESGEYVNALTVGNRKRSRSGARHVLLERYCAIAIAFWGAA